MTDTLSPSVWLAAIYSVVLLAVAWGLDGFARHSARKTAAWHAGGFVYHEDHDAWLCPQDQWLWPKSFDPDNRVMRYRASPVVCNSCPVKDTCTTGSSGREVTRNVDPWPASEAERFHRGIACCIVVLALVWPLASLFTARTTADLLVLLGVTVVVATASLPLWSHLRRTRSGFPDVPVGVKIETLDETVQTRAAVSRRERRRRATYYSDRFRTEP